MPPPPPPPSQLTLLGCPLEIRHHIYSSLLPPAQVLKPIQNVAFNGVSHAPPEKYLLEIHPQISHELLDYYHSIAIWKIILDTALNFFRIDGDLTGLETCPVLARLRKVELVLFYNGRHVDILSTKISRAVDVLLQAPELRTLIVSWMDEETLAPMDWAWQQKAEVCRPLQKLKERVIYRVGRVESTHDTVYEHSEKNRDPFVAALKKALARGDDGTTASTEDLSIHANNAERQRRHEAASASTVARFSTLTFNSRPVYKIFRPPTFLSKSIEERQAEGTQNWKEAKAKYDASKRGRRGKPQSD